MNISGFSKHYLYMIGFTLVMLNLHYFINTKLSYPFGGPGVFTHCFLLLMSFAGLFLLFRKIERVQSFMNRFFLFTVLKMFLSVFVIAGFVISYGKEQGVPFAVAFVILYLFYTAMESMLLIKKFKSIANELGTDPR